MEAQWDLGFDSHLIDAQLGFVVRRRPTQPFDEGSARIFVRASPGQTENSENSEIQRFERTGRKARKNEGSMSSRCAVEGVCQGPPNSKSTELDEEGLEFALASGKQLTGTQDVASVHPVSVYSQVCAGNSWSAHATSVS